MGAASILDQQQQAGSAAADEFVNQNPTIPAIKAELDRLLWGQRDTEIAAWLCTREGSFYRSRLGEYLTAMEAGARHREMLESDRQKREAEEAQALKVRDNSVEARLDRIEAILLRRLGEAL